MRRALLIPIFVAAALAPTAAHATTPTATPKSGLPPAGPFPDAPCDLQSRMDIYIGPDGTLWECVCEHLATGYICDWFEQGSVNATQIRRRARTRLHVRALPRLVVIRL